MTDLYELQVVVGDESGFNGNAVRMEHRFADLPDIETVKALRTEAMRWYEALHGEEPGLCQVVALRLTNQEIAYQTGTADALYKAGQLS